MTTFTKRYQIVPVVCSTFRKGYLVVDFLNRGEPTFLETHLAEGMLLCVAVTDSFPRSAILSVYLRVTLVFVVLLPCGLSVFLAELSVTEVGTSGIRTRSLRAFRHGTPPFRA